MTLREYLESPKAIEDMKVLLGHEVGRVVYICDDKGALWRGIEGAWHQVCAWLTDETGRLDLCCYYRPDNTGFVVSDCGESVSALMQRTGKRWEECLAMAGKVTGLVGNTNAGDVRLAMHGRKEPASMLVAVLSAVARVREVSP